MKNNINKKISTTLLAAAIMAGTAVIPMSNAAVEAKVNEAPKIKISAHVQDIGWMDPVDAKEGNVVGTFWQSRRVEAMKFDLRECPGVTLTVVAHVQDYGDMTFEVSAEDYDKLVGTQWESKRMEAVTITSHGLHEQGYKLQYRAHVQDYGWLDWVEEGEMGGTRWEAKRVEAIEMKMVPITDLSKLKVETITMLNGYDIALSDYDTKKVPETTYKRLSTQIKETISAINSANSEAEINEIFAEQVKKLERYTTPDTMEDVVEKTQEKYTKALSDINQLIEDYERFIPNSSYNQGEKDRLYAIIADTKTKLSQAKTANDITNKTTGIQTGLASLVKPFNLDTKLANYKELVKASENAYKNISEYQRAIDNSTISQTYKNLANASITKAENQIAVAVEEGKTATDIQNIMNELKEMLTDRVYSNIVKDAEKEIAINEANLAKAEAIEVLEEYTVCGYEDIEKVAKKALEDIDKLTDATAINNRVTSEETALKKSLATAETKKIAYDTAVKNAMITLNGTLDAMDEIELSDDEFESIARMIEVTKTSIENIEINSTDKVTTAVTTVSNLLKEFNTYMSTYHKDINGNVKEYQFNSAKENALLILSEYIDSDNKAIKNEATAAKQFVDTIKYDFATVDAKIKSINDKLAVVANNIEVEMAKEEALNLVDSILEELDGYLDSSIYDVRAFANTAINTIKSSRTIINSKTGDANKVITEIETEIGKVEAARTTAIEKITDSINKNAEAVEKELQAAKEKALKEIEKYIELAEYLEYESLEAQLNIYWSSVYNTNELSEVNSIVSYSGNTLGNCLLKTLIDKEDAKLVVRADALRMVDDKYIAIYTNEDKTINEAIKNDAVLKAEFDAAKENIKKMTIQDSDTAEAIATAQTTAIDTNVQTWESSKNTAVEKITIADGTLFEAPILESSIRRITERYITLINDVTYGEYYSGDQGAAVATTITDKQNACKNEVIAELIAELTAYAHNEFTTKVTDTSVEFTSVQTIIDGIKTSMEAKTSVDEIIALAVTTAIDTEIDTLANN